MIKALFANFALGYDSGMQTLAGHAGQHYGGPSRFSHEYGCQIIETEFKDRAALIEAQKQISLTFKLYGKAWVLLPPPETSAGQPMTVETIKDVSDDLLVMEYHRRFPVIIPDPTSLVEIAPETKPPEPSPKEEKAHDRMSMKKLEEIASKNVIDITGLLTRSEVAAAINIELENRALGASPVTT